MSHHSSERVKTFTLCRQVYASRMYWFVNCFLAVSGRWRFVDCTVRTLLGSSCDTNCTQKAESENLSKTECDHGGWVHGGLID